MSERSQVLVLGGTAEALRIAEELAARGDVRVVAAPEDREQYAQAAPAFDVRVGGFADAEALADFVAERHVSTIVDAFEPFSDSKRRQAAEVAVSSGTARIVFERPVPEESDDDAWIRVRHTAEAADLLPGFARRVLLDLPRTEVAEFARLNALRFLVRGVQDEELPLHDYEQVSPTAATLDEEVAFLREYEPDMVVLRENGSDAGARLLQAARVVELPVMLLERPALPPSTVLTSVEEIVAWVRSRLEDDSKLGAAGG